MKSTVANAIFNSYSYSGYRKLVKNLLLEGKATGSDHSENLIRQSNLNDALMNHLDEILKISKENILKLDLIKKNYTWLVIAEGWCSDSAQLLPVFNFLSNESKKIDFKIVLRYENENLMNFFLKDGSKSIPKLIVVEKESGNVCGSWGPRPQGAIELIKNYKEKFGKVDAIVKAELQMWYLNDNGFSTQNELIDFILDLEK
ncbi:MAG: thioredoxin family protein [Flavobacterium sp.]|uniref:thioredoxin family protein n=1 Tax=Flavobacterium sp. TaxID=239 RepID=UPI002617E9C0|nr:thioredoxin family protein [Flavobacterium sp.]MDD5151343.1 thioredoxin family protein [Flavobacterium sp.]